ncbi:hypothetical protein CLF_103073, partial [Clonorchis sinensis]
MKCVLMTFLLLVAGFAFLAVVFVALRTYPPDSISVKEELLKAIDSFTTDASPACKLLHLYEGSVHAVSNLAFNQTALVNAGVGDRNESFYERIRNAVETYSGPRQETQFQFPVIVRVPTNYTADAPTRIKTGEGVESLRLRHTCGKVQHTRHLPGFISKSDYEYSMVNAETYAYVQRDSGHFTQKKDMSDPGECNSQVRRTQCGSFLSVHGSSSKHRKTSYNVGGSIHLCGPVRYKFTLIVSI